MRWPWTLREPQEVRDRDRAIVNSARTTDRLEKALREGIEQKQDVAFQAVSLLLSRMEETPHG